jgi:hypothetical protein
MAIKNSEGTPIPATSHYTRGGVNISIRATAGDIGMTESARVGAAAIRSYLTVTSGARAVGEQSASSDSRPPLSI